MEELKLPVSLVSKAEFLPEDQKMGESTCKVRVCGLCVVNPAKYTCPRCNLPYCSLSCYTGSVHSTCSERFYKDCVSEALKGCGRSQRAHRQRIKEVLLRIKNEGGAMNKLMEQDGTEGMKPEELVMLSSLVKIQEGEGENNQEEEADILSKLAHSQEVEEEQEEEVNLAMSLSGLNIETLSEDELWTLLPQKEKQKFKELLKSGGIGGLVPAFSPWWEEHEHKAAVLVEVLQAEEQQESHSQESGSLLHHPSTAEMSWRQSPGKKVLRSAPPSICCKIPTLGSLCSTPSPLVCFSLVNVLYGYAFSLLLFNGDVWEEAPQAEFVELVMDVCETLRSGRTFNTTSEALCAAQMAVSSLRQAQSTLTTTAAVAHILSGRSLSEPAGYTLCVLSHLRRAFSAVRTAATPHHPIRRRCFLAGKKITFLLAWTNENPGTLSTLAREVWKESGQASKERETMERQKQAVEKVRRMTRKALIQEL